MNEIKGYFTAIFIIIFWSAICGFGGYILSNSRAIEQLEQANKQLAEQQQKNDDLIKRAREQADFANQQLRTIGDQLSQQVQSSGRATEELSELVKQIQKQKLSIQV